MGLVKAILITTVGLLLSAPAAAGSHEGSCTAEADFCGLFEDTSSLIAGANERDQADLMTRLAQAMALHGQFGLAENLIADADALGTGNWERHLWFPVLLNLGVAQSAAGLDNAAAATFENILDAADAGGPGNVATKHFDIAAGMQGIGQVDAASRWFDAGMAVLSENPEVAAEYVFYQFMPLVRQGMLDEAEELLGWAIENEIQIVAFAGELGTIADAGRPQLVQGIAEIAYNMDAATDVAVTMSLSVAHAQSGDLEMAEALLEEAEPRALPLIVAPLRVNNLRAAAVARAQSGDVEGATALLDLVGDEPTPFDVITLARMAAAFTATGHNDQARTLLTEAERLIQEADQDGVIVDGSAEVAIAYASAGQIGDAARVLGDAVALMEQRRGSLSPVVMAWLANGHVKTLMALPR